MADIVTDIPFSIIEPWGNNSIPKNRKAATSIIMIFIYTLAILMSTLGNSLAILVFCLGRRSKTDLWTFLLSLAVSDLLIGLFCLPFTFTNIYLGYWPFPGFVCTLILFLQVVAVTTSISANTAIGLDRLWVVYYPLRSRVTKSRSRTVVIGIWIGGIVMSSVQLFVARKQVVHGTARCGEIWTFDWLKQCYNLFLLVIYYLLPLCLLCITYSLISRRLWRRTVPGNADVIRDINHLKSKRKTIKMLVMVILFFGVCWLPLHVFHIFMDLGENFRILTKEHEEWMYIACHWLATANSFVNPLIYGFMNESFRIDLLNLIFRAFCCNRNLQRGSIATRDANHMSTSCRFEACSQMGQRLNQSKSVSTRINHPHDYACCEIE